MVNFILILLVVEIIAFIWLIGKIDGLKDTIAKINNDIETCGFKGSLTEFRLSVEIFNKKFETLNPETAKKDNFKILDKIIQICIFSFSVYKWYKHRIPMRNRKLLPRK